MENTQPTCRENRYDERPNGVDLGRDNFARLIPQKGFPPPSMALIDEQISKISIDDVQPFQFNQQDSEILIQAVNQMMKEVRHYPERYDQNVRQLIEIQAQTKQRIIDLNDALTRERDLYITQVQMYKQYMLKLFDKNVRLRPTNYSQTIQGLVERLNLTDTGLKIPPHIQAPQMNERNLGT